MIYFRQKLRATESFVIVLGNPIALLVDRLGEVLGNVSPGTLAINPFLSLAAIAAEYDVLMAGQLETLDMKLRQFAAKTGHTFYPSITPSRASTKEYASLKEGLHELEAEHVFYEKTATCLLHAVEFLQEQHEVLKTLHRGSSAIPYDATATCEKVASSLRRTASSCQGRLLHITTLLSLVRIQLDVVRPAAVHSQMLGPFIKGINRRKIE